MMNIFLMIASVMSYQEYRLASLSHDDFHGSRQLTGDAIRPHGGDLDIETLVAGKFAEGGFLVLGETVAFTGHGNGVAHIVIEHRLKGDNPELYIQETIVDGSSHIVEGHQGAFAQRTTLPCYAACPYRWPKP